MPYKTVFKILVIFFVISPISAQNEPSLPSHLPSPPKDPSPGGRPGGGRPEGGRPGGRPNGRPNNRPSQNDLQFEGDEEEDHRGVDDSQAADSGPQPGSLVPNPPPQNAPTGPPPPDPEPNSEPTTEAPPPTPVIFGLNHIILILVPQFKVKIPNLPKWIGANCKVSLPITVFFDKLVVPGNDVPAKPFPASPFYGPVFPGGHFVKKRNAKELLEQNTDTKKAQKPNSLLNDERYRAERVTLIPKLEKLLDSFGFGGKACLLRAICEVHEYPLQHHGYGLVGEVLTLFFSISRSVFADSHLSEYLAAEDVGKTGDCKKYFKACPTSLFYWERIHEENDAEYDEDELALLDQLFVM